MITLKDARDILHLQLGGYFEVRQSYHADVSKEIHTYLTTNESRSDFEAAMVMLIVLYFKRAGDDAFYSMNQSDNEMDVELLNWLRTQQEAEAGYVSDLGVRLAGLRELPDTPLNAGQYSIARADGYTRTLDRIYANIKVGSSQKTMLTFDGFDGFESCSDCQLYKGKRHTARWWWMMDAVPPNRNFECKGYRCEHFLRDDQGYLFTF